MNLTSYGTQNWKIGAKFSIGTYTAALPFFALAWYLAKRNDRIRAAEAQDNFGSTEKVGEEEKE